MKGSTIVRLIAIGPTALLLLVPLAMVSDKISERRAIRDSAVHDIAQSGAGTQVLAGIALVTPCTEHWVEVEKDERGHRSERQRSRDCTQRQLPRDLAIDGRLDTELRYRGIYQALVYIARLGVAGRFTLEGPPDDPPAGRTRQWGAPYLSIGIEDQRGIKNTPALRWGEADRPFAGGAGRAPWAHGLHAMLPPLGAPGSEVPFAFTLDLAGMERLEFTPSAGEQRVKLVSSWPHPSFMGRFLPDVREISAQGFSSTWRVTDFAANARQAMAQCGETGCKHWQANRFGVAFVHPVDVYQKAWRAANYGLLFVLLTFGAIFLFEVTRGIVIHPLQYGLVGLALAMFFLLLIALSEHVAFLAAYLVAAGACIGVIAVYAGHVLRSRALGAGLGAILGALYAALYFVLGLEDYAFLTGAALAFGALALFMFATRRVDWYALSARVAEGARRKVGAGLRGGADAAP